LVAQAKSHGFEVLAQIPLQRQLSSDVSAQVLQLKEKNPDCVIFVLLYGGRDPLHEDDEEPEL